jgi:hypothetical protein
LFLVYAASGYGLLVWRFTRREPRQGE